MTLQTEGEVKKPGKKGRPKGSRNHKLRPLTQEFLTLLEAGEKKTLSEWSYFFFKDDEHRTHINAMLKTLARHGHHYRSSTSAGITGPVSKVTENSTTARMIHDRLHRQIVGMDKTYVDTTQVIGSEIPELIYEMVTAYSSRLIPLLEAQRTLPQIPQSNPNQITYDKS